MVAVVLKRLFLIRVANFSDRPLHIKPNMLVAISRPADNYLVSSADVSLLTIDHVTDISTNSEPLVDRTPFFLSQSEELVEPSLPSSKPETGDTPPLKTDSAMDADNMPWKERLNVGDGMKMYHSSLTDTLRPYGAMWSGKLGHVKDFACHIDVQPRSLPEKKTLSPHGPGQEGDRT